ncbi:hypothetical protein F5Y06DRAFT_214675 [Hypoxylon sp. FL0890]|nr:hypothetical protein F5Y06DRAFT_214675 [Hypoxylon sp. FL0890]
MDPVSAVGVAAAAVQFAEITFKITKRIAVFTVLRDVPDAEGPKTFVERLRNQLGLLNSTVQRIEEGLTNYPEGFRDSELLELSDYVSNLNRHARKLDELLTRYLPNDDASTPTRLWAAMKSIGSDLEIESVMASINQLLPLLTTFLLTSMVFKGRFLFGTNAEPTQRQPTPSAIYQVSRYEVRHFVDRPGLLTEIGCLFDNQATQSPKIVILQGMGGQGKTQLALRYCANVRLQRRFGYILWVDASSKASTLRGLEEISKELNDSNQALLDTDARLAFVRRKLTTTNLSWLLVFDNYDDPSAFDLREYIPNNPLGNVLITSRSTDAERIGSMIHISGMTEDEATKLLYTQLDASEDVTNRIPVADIVRRLGYLPLAIDQAGAYMKAEGVPLVQFLSHYEQSARDILNSVPNLWEYTESASSEHGGETTNVVAKTVFTTWNLSFGLLKPDTSTGHLKATVLSLLAFFDEHEISEEYFQAYCSTNRPGQQQQPEWISLFTDGNGQWSSGRFDSLMREFARLSLITALNVDRKDSEYAVISLHPLVRDWINLRQENSIHRANFMTFTQLLAAVLLLELRNDHFSFDWWFTPSSTQRRQLHAHITYWMRIFGRYKSDLQPTILTSESEGQSVATSSEQLIVKYLYYIGLFKNSLELSHWIWESCDISDDQMLQVKFAAGQHEVESLESMDLYEEAKHRSREKLQYWKTIFGDNASYDDMRNASVVLLIRSLLCTINLQDKQEAIELCRSQLGTLQNNERNMPKRYEFLIDITIAAGLLGQGDVRNTTLETILNETVRCNRNDFWKKIRSYYILYQVTRYAISYSDDYDIKDQLSLAVLELAAYMGEAEYFQSRILRAAALSSMEMFIEAEAMVRDCIARFATMPFSRLLYGDAYETLGNVLMKQERHEEAYEAHSSALLQLNGPELQNHRLRVLDECASAAKKFNLELADAHSTLRLSLLKKTEDWGIIIGNTMDLYALKVEIGTETAAQDGLKLLIEGLELYGVEFIHETDNVRTHPRQINATINLNDPESLQGLAEDGILQKALLEKLGGWYGFDLLIRMAYELLRTADATAAEQAFRLAKAAFEKANDTGANDVTNFIDMIFRYMELHFKVDRDDQSVRDVLDWARLQIREKLGNGMKNIEDWWKTETKILVELANSAKADVGEETRESEEGETTASEGTTTNRPPSPLSSTAQSSKLPVTAHHWGESTRSSVMQRLAGGLSRTRILKLPPLSSSKRSLTLRRGLKSVQNTAASPASPATVRSQDGRMVEVLKS